MKYIKEYLSNIYKPDTISRLPIPNSDSLIIRTTQNPGIFLWKMDQITKQNDLNITLRFGF